tara:strand:- start:8670 stop:9425 length:756 start_codon:yes stop_codon:yes gene_type:complete
MKINLSTYKILKQSIWDKRFLKPIHDIVYGILTKYKNKERYIQDILSLREHILKCDRKLVNYGIGDVNDKHFVRIVEVSVTNDMRFLILEMYRDIVENNHLDDVPNIIVLEYCILRETFMKLKVIDENYGLNISEKDYLNDILITHPEEDDYSKYLLDKHHSHITFQVTEYMDDDTRSQYLINSVLEYQNELIEMCPVNINVEDIEVYTHSAYEFSLPLLPSVAKLVKPLFSELLGIELNISSTKETSYTL